jgi:hypothetical protein
MSETPTRPLTAVEQAAAEAYGTDPADAMTEDHFMPTCMIWTMFIGLGIMIAAMVLWAVINLPRNII